MQLAKLLTNQTIIIRVALTTTALALVVISLALYWVMQEYQRFQAQSAEDIEKYRALFAQASFERFDALVDLDQAQSRLQEIREIMEEQEDRVVEIEDEYEKINSTVRDLLKLGSTDEELLQKYSRVYFLNENYIPSDLEMIDKEYLWGDKALQIHGSVERFLDDLMDEAEDDGMELRIISAYRSFDYQGALKNQYLTIYGSGANQFSADQGYSEHQLGTTIDFTTPKIGSAISRFDETDEFKWLQDNAHRFGFVLSYPPNNSYYQYEPWHWRFVGKDLADDLHDDDQYFYDLPQRKINEYLLGIFDR
ncbi:MAG: D-alanyl-D-alanine carboxypeptidase family protein [Patescibacteria group bacterium]